MNISRHRQIEFLERESRICRGGEFFCIVQCLGIHIIHVGNNAVRCHRLSYSGMFD